MTDMEKRTRRVAMEIIEVFEDFLTERGIRVPTSDKEMTDDDALDGNSAVIYGSDYGELEAAIVECLMADRG